jgi:hypothetical protein
LHLGASKAQVSLLGTLKSSFLASFTQSFAIYLFYNTATESPLPRAQARLCHSGGYGETDIRKARLSRR